MLITSLCPIVDFGSSETASSITVFDFFIRTELKSLILIDPFDPDSLILFLPVAAVSK